MVRSAWPTEPGQGESGHALTTQLVLALASAGRLADVVAAWIAGHDLDVDALDAEQIVWTGARAYWGALALDRPFVDAPPPATDRNATWSRLLELTESLGVEIRYGHRAGARGLADLGGHVVEIDPDDPQRVELLAHEVAHTLDTRPATSVSVSERERFADDLGALLIAGGVTTASSARALAAQLASAPLAAPTPRLTAVAADVAAGLWWASHAER